MVGLLDVPLERLPGLARSMARVLATRYWPPELAHVTRPDYLRAFAQTLEMSFAASVLGLGAAMPLAWVAAFNVSPARRIGHPLARFAITAARSVHEMVWTIVLVAVVGFGMLAGTLALTVFCVGFAGKLLAEAVEAIDPGPVEAIRAAGGGELQVLLYAVLPQVRVAWASIAIYTWDVVFRAATVVGFFGAGGMGTFLRESVQQLESQQVAAILLSIVAVVIAAEVLSAWARAQIARAAA
jgi:phosphonate transport system permease protein